MINIYAELWHKYIHEKFIFHIVMKKNKRKKNINFRRNRTRVSTRLLQSTKFLQHNINFYVNFWSMFFLICLLHYHRLYIDWKWYILCILISNLIGEMQLVYCYQIDEFIIKKSSLIFIFPIDAKNRLCGKISVSNDGKQQYF